MDPVPLSLISSAAHCCFICLFDFLQLLLSLPVTCLSSILLFPELLLIKFDLFFFFLISTSPHSLSLLLTFLFFLHSSHPLFISCSSSSSLFLRVTLDPSKRQSSNKSMSGCTLPQGTKTVSKSSFPMFSGCFCLSVCQPVCLSVPVCLCPVIPSARHAVCCRSGFGYTNMLSGVKLV